MARDYRESEERRGAASQPQPRGTAAPAHVGVAAQVVDALPVGVAVCELAADGAVFPLFVSEAACAMYGCTRAEYDQGIAQGKPLFTLDDMASAVERLGGAASLSGDYDVQVRTRRIDGAPFDVRVQARVIPGACGMAEMYAVLSDVTEEVREQRKRAWQNERYRLLSELHACDQLRLRFRVGHGAAVSGPHREGHGRAGHHPLSGEPFGQSCRRRASGLPRHGARHVRVRERRGGRGRDRVSRRLPRQRLSMVPRQPVRRERRRGRMASGGARSRASSTNACCARGPSGTA